jgi:hypothetical protein
VHRDHGQDGLSRTFATRFVSRYRNVKIRIYLCAASVPPLLRLIDPLERVNTLALPPSRRHAHDLVLPTHPVLHDQPLGGIRDLQLAFPIMSVLEQLVQSRCETERDQKVSLRHGSMWVGWASTT